MPQKPDPNRRRCAGKTKDGRPCPKFEANGTPFCPAHDPALAAQRTENGRKRGPTERHVLRTVQVGGAVVTGTGIPTIPGVLKDMHEQQREIRDLLRRVASSFEHKLSDPDCLPADAAEFVRVKAMAIVAMATYDRVRKDYLRDMRAALFEEIELATKKALMERKLKIEEDRRVPLLEPRSAPGPDEPSLEAVLDS